MDRKQLAPGRKEHSIKKVLENRMTADQLMELAPAVEKHDLSQIIQRNHDLNEQQVARIAALDSVLGKVDALKNVRRNAAFIDQKKKLPWQAWKYCYSGRRRFLVHVNPERLIFRKNTVWQRFKGYSGPK